MEERAWRLVREKGEEDGGAGVAAFRHKKFLRSLRSENEGYLALARGRAAAARLCPFVAACPLACAGTPA